MLNKEIDFCIICNKKFDDVVVRSKEHIIPESLGNTKLVTFGVCKKCNNDLGRIVDSYLVNNIIFKLLRKSKLEKDKNIKLSEKTIFKDINDREYLIKNDKLKVKPNIDISYDKDNSISIRVIASSEKECKDILTKRLRREFKFLTEKAIEDIVNNPISIIQENNLVELKYSEIVNYSKIYLGSMKIAYEYAVEKLGFSYIQDKIAKKIRNYLYMAITEKKDINDIIDELYHKIASSFNFSLSVCNDIREAYNINNFSKCCNLLKIRHFICLTNRNETVHCMVRLFNEDVSTFDLLLSENMIFKGDKKTFITFITEDNEIIEF